MRIRLIRRCTSLALVGCLAPAVALASCTGSDTGGRTGGRLQVIAAENFWGDLAAELGGDQVEVKSVITSPASDPHDYEPTAADGRSVATADYLIYNGAGYDPWAAKLAAANPAGGRIVLDVGALAGVKRGGNPHVWYSPPVVLRVVDRITADYKKLRPARASYFERRKVEVKSRNLARYLSLVNDIRTRFAGTPVGASESIFAPLATALGLDLRTPSTFLKAISEGNEPSAADKATVDAQISGRQIKVYVFNKQNSSPDVTAAVNAAERAQIPVVTITETPTPAGASFETWQVQQLQALANALAKATAR